MAQYSFGSGLLFGRNLQNSPATPVRFGALQDVSIDISFSVKELFGQSQFPLAIGRGTGKITGKANFAQFNAQAFNDLFFGLTNPATGSQVTVSSESKSVVSNAATATNNATYLRDLGVTLNSDGSVLTRVTSGPTAAQYTVNESTGVYGFNLANATVVLLNYQYTDASNGKLITISNQLLGNAPTFLAVFTETFQAKKFTMVLNSCMSSKLALATKLEDFTIPSFDFQAFADSSGNLGTMSQEE